jgi:ABC-type antimicrobial peptide transport system permease subunit
MAMIALGSSTGIGLGLVSQHYVAAFLYQAKAIDLDMLSLPVVTMFAAAALAAVPPAPRAVRLDPAALLRSE